MKLSFLLCAVLCGVAIPVLAQKPNPTPIPYPGGAALSPRAPERAKWIITYNPKKGPEEGAETATESQDHKTPAYSQRVTVVKSPAFIFERVVSANGQVRDKWSVSGLTFSKAPNEKAPVVYDQPNLLGTGYYSDYSKTDFPGFEWVAISNYKDIKKVMGRDCLVFHQDGEGKNPGAVAYVDYRSRLPVLLQRNGEVRVYQFEAPPSGEIKLPPEAETFLQARAKLKAEAQRAAITHGR